MAKDTTCITKVGDKWQVRIQYRDELTGRTRIYKRRLYGTLDDAIAVRDEARIAIYETGSPPQEQQAGTQLRSFLRSYFRSMLTRGQNGRAISRTTAHNHQRALDNHVLPAVGDWRVGHIRRRDVEAVVDEWATQKKPNGKRYSPASVNTWLKVMRQLMRHAYEIEEAGRSPCEDVKPLATAGRTTTTHTCLTVEEANALLEAMKSDRFLFYHPMVLIGLTTGARFSEISALHWDDVDEDREILRLHHSQVEGRRKAGSKTNKKKTFPLLPEIATALAEHRRRMVADEHPAVASGIVFPARVDPATATHGGYMQRWTLHGVLKKACAAAGVPVVTPHDFRVFFNTRMLQSGVHPELVRAMTGHTTQAMTEHYAHVSPTDKITHLAPLMRGLTGGTDQS